MKNRMSLCVQTRGQGLRRLLVCVGMALLIIALAYPATLVSARSTGISWSDESLELNLSRGATTTLTFSISSHGDLVNASLWVTPEISQFVSLTPSAFDMIEAGGTYPFTVSISIPQDCPIGYYDGAIHLRAGRRTIPQPLKVLLNIGALIGPDGGDVVGSGGAMVSIPPGALQEDQLIEINAIGTDDLPAPLPDNTFLLGGVRVEPSIVFGMPVTITAPLSESFAAGTPFPVLLFDALNNEYRFEIGALVTAPGNSVTFNVTHFSHYVIPGAAVYPVDQLILKNRVIQQISGFLEQYEGYYFHDEGFLSLGDIEKVRGRLYDDDIQVYIYPEYLDARNADAAYVDSDIWVHKGGVKLFYNDIVIRADPLEVDGVILYHEAMHAIFDKHDKELSAAGVPDDEALTWYMERADLAIRYTLLPVDLEFAKFRQGLPFNPNTIQLGLEVFVKAMEEYKQDPGVSAGSGPGTLPPITAEALQLLKQLTGLDVDAAGIRARYESLLASELVEFPDPALEAVIREAIGKPTGDIYRSHLLGLTSLWAWGIGIYQLTGLEYCTNVSMLYLHHNLISDISPLVNNPGLGQGDFVWLDGNPLSEQSINDYIPALRARGVTVYYDEEGEEGVYFACPNLEAAIREAIGKPTGPIYKSELLVLTNLRAYNRGIVDLRGLEHAVNLRLLALGANMIRDVSPLTGLTGLTWLYLWSNQISDIAPLAYLTNLSDLALEENRISDISPLAGLTGLRSLELGNNRISDISPLAGLTGLTSLYLWSNQISDISPLAGLTGLTTLQLRRNEISDISALANLASLRDLNLAANHVNDVSPLSNLSSLTGLRLGVNEIIDISPLANLTSLTHLDLQLNQVSDISPVASLISLTILQLRENEISDISPLANLTNLRDLWLDGNPTGDISPLADLTSLTSLHLAENHISDISPLANLTSLNQLDLSFNRINDISPLANLTNLGTLSLVYVRMTDISPLANLISLRSLNLGYTDTSDISPLANLINLEVLNLEWNDIGDISPLANLTSLRSLDLSLNQLIGDISPLANLTSLAYLDLPVNQIDDISPLASLTRLLELDVQGNQIIDISPLANLTNLTHLNLGSNQISDISPLTSLTSLTELILYLNEISDISPLANLTSLTELHLWDNQIGDISPLANLINLTDLSLGGNQISGISALASLTGLTQLDLRFNRIIDISPLTNLTLLTELSLMINLISDVSPLADLTEITGLNLRHNRISDISPLANLTSLESLDLRDNWVIDAMPLVQNEGLGVGDEVDVRSNLLDAESINTYIPQLEARGVIIYYDEEVHEGIDIADPNLEAAIREATGKPTGPIYPSDLAGLLFLEAYGRNIGDLRGLEYCIDLMVLDLGYNQIYDIWYLADLTQLTELYLWGNEIYDISPLTRLTNLEFIDLSYNWVYDINPLVDNPGLGEGDTVVLTDNPLSEQSLNEYIPILQARGVIVYY